MKKIKRFEDLNEQKLNERIDINNIDDVKGYLHEHDPIFTYEWMDTKDLPTLLGNAVYLNLGLIESINRQNDGAIGSYKSRKDASVGHLETMFNDSLSFINLLKDFYRNISER